MKQKFIYFTKFLLPLFLIGAVMISCEDSSDVDDVITDQNDDDLSDDTTGDDTTGDDTTGGDDSTEGVDDPEIVDGRYAISSAEQLAYIGQYDNYPLSGEYVLTSDIYLDGNWTPIGTYKYRPFTGLFDGDVYTIYGLTIEVQSGYQALFGYAVGATFKNVTLNGCSITYTGEDEFDYIGGVVAFADGASTIENCANNDGNIEVTSCRYVGGIVGCHSEDSSITECQNSTSITAVTGTWVGGIVGVGYGSISKCHNTASLWNGYQHVGGIAGLLNYEKSSITECYNSGEITGLSHVGGVIGSGYLMGDISNCYNTGTITGNVTTSYTYTGSNAGGIVGNLSGGNDDQTISGCYNSGEVSGHMSVGGIAGTLPSYTFYEMTNCYNEGDIYSTFWGAGGIAGSGNSSMGSATITSCYNTGSVTADYGSAGGLFGGIAGATITECYNTGKVCNTNLYTTDYPDTDINYDMVGGLIGSLTSNSILYSCYNSGDVESSGYYAGGVVGNVTQSTIDVSYNVGSVTAKYYAGGIAGKSINTSAINATFNAGELSGSNIGGIVGYCNSCYIYDCLFLESSNYSSGVGNNLYKENDSTSTTIAKLNASVDDLNDAALNSESGDIYFVASSSTSTELPYLVWER